jgi:Na+-translocating ferredoxin:NAD+ oxidoreductase RnfD subunit
MLSPLMTSRTLTIGQGSYPLVLPNVRDPRLHVAAVIISVHVLGQVGLHFWVSVPQILAAILTCWVIEVAITFAKSKAFVWPASAMLTGSGVALILRVVGTPPAQPWSTDGVGIFAAVAGLSLLSKYVIRYRGSHVFNPSNIGLVLAFVILGSTRVEPLDFWWAPLTNPAMVVAYAVILGGGLLITRRLRLLPLAVAYWLALAVGLGVLAASGHSMVARWSFAPVTGFDYWRAIVTSPEVLIFLFFMITDPKTVPQGRVGRVVFGGLVAVVGTLLMAPQTDEFGTKVGLLSGLVVVSAVRPMLERVLPAPGSEQDSLRWQLARLLPGVGFRAVGPDTAAPAGTAGRTARPARRAAGLAAAAIAVVVLSAGIVLAGAPARGIVIPASAEVLNRLPQQVDPATLPSVVVGQDVTEFDPTLVASGEMQAVLVTLAQNLEYENQAVLAGNPTILTAVDHGDRLAQMRAIVATAATTGLATTTHYAFDRIEVHLIVPFGVQDGFSLGMHGTGTATRETRDRAGNLVSREASAFDDTFAVRRATGDRWLTVAVLRPADVPG